MCLLDEEMGLGKIIKKASKAYNKVLDKQAEMPYRLQKSLKHAWSQGRRESKTFNKFTKGVEKAKSGFKAAYNSKISKSIGKKLDSLQKTPFVGGVVKDVRDLARGVVKDPFAVRSNLFNLTKVALDRYPAFESGNMIADAIAGKGIDYILDRFKDPIARRERRARDRVNNKRGRGSGYGGNTGIVAGEYGQRQKLPTFTPATANIRAA